MDLSQLKKEIPYQWRVQQYSQYDTKASCVAYIDARDVMKLLDEVCGPENWQDKYESIDGKLFAAIGIRIGKGFESPDDWVWKYDTGSESNIEKEKGEVSDSFKRAAVKWGVGRFLYDLPIKHVQTNVKLVKDAGNRTYPHVVDENGSRVWDLTRYINGTAKTATPIAEQPDQPMPEVPVQQAPRTPAPVAQTQPVQQQPVSRPATSTDNPPCPVCKGEMYDCRMKKDGGKGLYPKTNPKAPDFRCKKKECASNGGVIWPPKNDRPIAEQPDQPMPEVPEQMQYEGVDAISTDDIPF